MKCIVRCGCGGIQTYIKSSIDALGLSPVGEENTYIGRDKIQKLSREYRDTPFGEHLVAIGKKSGRFAFYIETNDKNEISSMYNLINGKKVY